MLFCVLLFNVIFIFKKIFKIFLKFLIGYFNLYFLNFDFNIRYIMYFLYLMYYKYIILSVYLKIKINVNFYYFEMKKNFINKKCF